MIFLSAFLLIIYDSCKTSTVLTSEFSCSKVFVSLLQSDVTQVWLLRPPRCEHCDLRCVQQQEKNGWFLSAEHETSLCSLMNLNAPGPLTESLEFTASVWTEVCTSCHVLWVLPVSLSSAGRTWLPWIRWTSWSDRLPGKRGSTRLTWRKGKSWWCWVTDCGAPQGSFLSPLLILEMTWSTCDV